MVYDCNGHTEVNGIGYAARNAIFHWPWLPPPDLDSGLAYPNQDVFTGGNLPMQKKDEEKPKICRVGGNRKYLLQIDSISYIIAMLYTYIIYDLGMLKLILFEN